ncbi:ATP-grasp domain-containing protein [Streptomyces sp. CC224B]|uniref:ATP-grasp domain-containing protein n=1 Tax=Streptomyces sp. CC224B TaxID=3044571 RepID=UPI0024A7F8C3|nr:ATP-grasp domain-containing protein [Streptomyces sp. CC224B]
MPTIIVLGYRDDLDRALRRRGLDPWYLTQPPGLPPGKVRHTRVSDIENVQEILRAVLAADLDDVAGVLTVHEMGVFGAACLRQHLGLPGNTDARTVPSFRDKCLQKRALPSHISRARCRYVSRDTPFAEVVDELGDVFVVKPATGAGSLRTTVVRSADAYGRALELFPGDSDVAVVAESFVDAPEVYIDGVWADGRLRWSSMTRYHDSPLSAAHGGVLAAHLLDRRRHEALFREAETLARDVLAHLGAPACVFHLEAFVRESGLTFGECAIRLPGALSPQVNELTYGVDLFDVEIRLALGQGLDGALPVRNGRAPDRFHGYVLLRRPRSGTLTREDFERGFRFDDLAYSSSPDTPPGPYGKVGHAIVSDPDERELRRTIEGIVLFNEAGRPDAAAQLT